MTDADRLSPWRTARLIDRSAETPDGANLVFAVEHWGGHRAGQHVDLRLTADDGYQAQRSYSIASAPAPGMLTLTVERLQDGEVSPYLVDEMRGGDTAEIQGPVGDWFVWSPEVRRPLLLIAGGFGIVPLMSMLRLRQAVAGSQPARLIISARSKDRIPYADDLAHLEADDPLLEITRIFTEAAPEEPLGARRLNRDRLTELVYAPALRPSVYVCGPTGFVETVADALVDLGHDAGAVRTERFGATGEQGQLRAA